MKNIKVRVKNEAESKEVQGLFDSLGLLNRGWSGFKFPKLISNHIFGEYSDYLLTDAGINHYKELTIPQLRDLVVLKRNDVVDATHTCNGHKYYLTGSEFYEYINEHWENVDEWVDGCSFKPIEKKEMKEFLVNHNDKWTLQLLDADTEENSFRVAVKFSWVNFAYKRKCNGELFFSEIELNVENLIFVWQRHTQPEELPFVDDEPVNNPSHYTSGNIECLDAMQAMLSPDEFIGFLRGNIFKYQWRYKLKNGVEDLKKAQFYQNKLIELESKG